MTAGREDGTAGALGRLRASHADREQAVGVLKAAFVQGRLSKDEFDLRIGRVFASRTYADLDALTADIPEWVTSLQPPPAEDASEPGKMLSFRTAIRVGAVGASPSVASAAIVVMQSSTVPAAAGVLFVGLTGVVVAGLLAALLMLVSWVARRSQRRHAQGPPSGPAGLASKRQAPARQLPSAKHDPWKRPGAAGLACGLSRFRDSAVLSAWLRRAAINVRIHACVIERAGQDRYCDRAGAAAVELMRVIAALSGGYTSDDQPDDKKCRSEMHPGLRQQTPS